MFPNFAKKPIGCCVKLNPIDIKSFWLHLFSKSFCLLGPSRTPVPTKLIVVFPILQNIPSGDVFALKGIDIESFGSTFFQNPGNIRFYTKQRIEHYVRTTQHRIKSFLPLFFSKKRAGHGAEPHKELIEFAHSLVDVAVKDEGESICGKGECGEDLFVILLGYFSQNPVKKLEVRRLVSHTYFDSGEIIG